MIDEKLLALTQAAAEKLDAGGDENEDEETIRKQYAEAVRAVFAAPADDITPEQKIAAFDRLRAMMVDQMTDDITTSLDGGYYKDDDDEVYVYEEAMTACFGPRIFEVINQFEDLMPE